MAVPDLRQIAGSFLVYLMLTLTGLVSGPIYAQVAGATLNGTVADASGAGVPNANVSIKNTATGVVRDVTTDSDGFYSAPNLLPGTYEVTVSVAGFSTAVQTGLTLTVGAVQALNVPLKIGHATEKVEVVATAADVQLASSALSAEVSATTMRELPLNGRDWTQLATLQPGVISVRVEQGPSNRGNSGYGTLLTISGHQPFENNYRVDGLSINDYSNGSPGSTLGVNLGVDAIQEFSVLTGNYSSEYGRASGGVINAVTKSGTNEFHGDAYWFLRSRRLDARNYFDTTLPPFHRNQFGVSGGAPIVKNKTFIFADYEGIRQDKSDTFSNLVPSAAARAGSLCSQPDGTCQTSTITVDPKVKPYLGFWPLPNGGLIGNGDTGVFNTSGIERLSENYVTVRGDHHFSDKDILAASWFYDKAPLTQPDTLVDVLTENFTLRQMFSVEETHIFSPALVNTARVGFNRVRALITAPVSAINPLAKDPSLGAIPGRFAPELVVPGIATMDGSLGVISEDVLTWNSYQFYDDAFLTRSTHSLKFGFAWEHMQDSEFSGAGANGSFTFPSLAGFLQNQPATVTLDDPTSTRPIYVHQTLFGAYLQDDWHWRSNLTLNFGVRYEPVTLPTEAHNTFAVLTTLTSPAETPVKTLWASNQTLRNFQPRIGFAWTPAMLGDHTVIRGAFTVSSYLEGTGTNLRLPLNPPFTPAEINALYNNLSLPLTNTTDGIAGSASAASCAAPLYACYAQAFLRVWDPNVQPALADEWNLTIQHQLTHDTTFQVGYVGQKGTHLMVPFDYAQRALLPNSACVKPPCTANSPYFAANPTLYTVLGNPAQGGQGATVSGTKSNGTMAYNSLQAVLQKQMTHGLQAQVSYTFSKCMSDSTGYYGAWNNAISASAYWQNVYDQRAEWAPCYYDATHVLSAYAVYDLPFGRGKMLAGNVNKVVDEVIGGWEVSPIVSFRTGFPLPVYGASDQSGTFSRGARADCNSIPSVTDTPIAGIGAQWFTNNGNFTQPAVGTFGNCSPQLGSLRSPHYTDVDLSLHKNFQLTERFRLQFRTDFVNAFNHVQLNAPNMGLGSTMGQITSAQPPRNIQLALKLYY